MKKLCAAVVSAAMVGSVFAAEALNPAKVADFTGWTASAKDIENGVRITSTKYPSVTLKSIKSINVDLKKKYRISCEYRIAPGSKSTAMLYFAPVCYDKSGKEIASSTQYCCDGTQTVLAAPAKKGDKKILIKDGKKWFVQWGYAAFNAKADLSDLPNYDLVGIAAVKQNGDVWEIALKTPLVQDYPAGTSVREQRAGATYRYMFYAAPKTEWTKFTRVLQGAMRENVNGYTNTWRLGTVKGGIIFFTNGKPADIEFRNISLVEEK